QNRKVYVGKLNTQYGVAYLHGVGNYLAVSEGAQIEIWRVNEPTNPQQILKFPPLASSAGVAMWQEGTKYYLVVVEVTTTPPRNMRIYDATCIASGSCAQGQAPPVVGIYSMTHTVPANILFVTFSRVGGKPFLYLGGENMFSGGNQREYLVDVSNPTQPMDVTPQSASGYWGWYYYGNSTGFNWVMPRTAKFNGNYLYRAAFSLFDVHEFRGSSAPASAFTFSTQSSDGQFYAGDPITFTDTSTGFPTSWSWTFLPDGQ